MTAFKTIVSLLIALALLIMANILLDSHRNTDSLIVAMTAVLVAVITLNRHESNK